MPSLKTKANAVRFEQTIAAARVDYALTALQTACVISSAHWA
jgi:hypothetical protein